MNLHDDAEARVLLIPEGLLIPDDVLGINRPAHQEMKEWRKKKESTAFFRRERERERGPSAVLSDCTWGICNDNNNNDPDLGDLYAESGQT